MKERIAIVDGTRTPFAKAGMSLKDIGADDLGAAAVKEMMARTDIDPADIDELIFGNVAQPAHAANIARVIALKAGLPTDLVAYTVHRNCASGMESITTGANKILAGEAKIIIAGGTESMSNIPLLFNKKMTNLFMNLMKARTGGQKLAAILKFRPSFLAPIIGVQQGLTDPVANINMGQTAEVLAREFHITREEQDEFALMSHQRAIAARDRLKDEISPYPLPPKYTKIMDIDEGPRENQSIKNLQKLRPYFDRRNGTVTVANACPLTDGAAAVLLMTESEAKKRGYTPLGFLKAYAYAGLEPERMGLGPVYATNKLLKQGFSFNDFKLIEINEAFAAQVIACERAFESDDFAKTYLGRDKAIGKLSRDILNVNGGAIAIGHPVGTTGTRLVITLLNELRRRNQNLGLASLCIGGGQGAALALEVE
jgi:acetyl-CoA acetyltransferase family protein